MQPHGDAPGPRDLLFDVTLYVSSAAIAGRLEGARQKVP